MNNLEKETYCEPDFTMFEDEFINSSMSEEERKATVAKTIEFYNSFTDDDWIDLGNNY